MKAHYFDSFVALNKFLLDKEGLEVIPMILNTGEHIYYVIEREQHSKRFEK